MYAIRKPDLKRFTPCAKAVCRIEEGNTNAYLKNNRAIEDFLRAIEPRYNTALAKLRSDAIDEECVEVFAGFAAYVACCAPAGMRKLIDPIRTAIESTIAILERQGLLPESPEALGRRPISELITEGTLKIGIDEKYPQAVGIRTILRRLSILGNSTWEILRNEHGDTPFLTSDFPVAIENQGAKIANRIVPLAPDVAVRIIPDPRLSRAEPDLSFKSFRSRQRRPTHAEIVDVNRLIAQCAEELVFFRDDLNWIPKFVAKYRHCRIETAAGRVPVGDGFFNYASQRIVDRAA
jgi:hypothetical protein